MRYHNTSLEIGTQDNLTTALKLAKAGLPVFPARASTKRPHVKDWPNVATTDAAQLKHWWRKWPDAMPALPTGERSGVAVLDVDMKDGKDGIATLRDLGFDPEAMSSVRVSTPSGGQHIYFRHAEGLRSSAGQIGPGVDVRAYGGFVVAPGAINGKGAYGTIDGPLKRVLADLPTWPAKLAPPPRVARKSTGEKTGLPFAEIRDALMAIANNMDVGRDYWLHTGMALHHETDGDAKGLEAFHDWSAQHPTYDDAKTDAAWQSFGGEGRTARSILSEARCHGWRNDAEIERLIDECWTPDELAAKAQEALDAQTQDDIERLVGPLPRKALAKVEWGTPMMRGDKPVINLYNTTIYLGRNLDSILPGLAHNKMTGRDEWRDGQLTDAVVSIARMALEKRGLETVGKDLVADAAQAVARKLAYHPIRDQLDALRWDGMARLDSWLVQHAGADDTPYTRAVGRKFLLAMVARVMQPGCKHDHTLVLSGEQGQNKSTACRILAGADYFSDTLPSILGDKTDAIRHLQGIWLVEMAELAPSRKSDAEELKAFLSGATDRVRLPYAKFAETFPRQCVFVGTTNDDQFLRDATGGRRFWPVAVRQVIDAESLTAERDQLFAEAVEAYKAGEPWWLDRAFEVEHAAPVQAAAYVPDSWGDDVALWLDNPHDALGDESEVKTEVTMSQVLEFALGINSGRHSIADQRRAGDVLRQLGWIKVKTKSRNVWRRPE